MRFYIYIALLCAISFTSTAFAQVSNQFFKDQSGDHYIVSYQEEGQWILDHYLVKPNKLQKRVSQQIFKTHDQLLNTKTKVFGNKLNRKSVSVKSKYVTSELSLKIWEVKNTWDQNWEIKFSKWLEQEFNEDFFVKYNLETDCADVAFALRWIYARNNSLPALNTLAGSLVLFGQDSFKAEWKSLKRDSLWHKDEVFMAALKYILKHAFTGTLNIDGYPIELNKDSFLVGTIHLMGGHTLIISEIDYSANATAPIWKLNSTVPSAVRVLNREMMIDSQMTDASIGGLFRMRWPVSKDGVWSLIPKDKMPLYSVEQYSQEFIGDYGNFTVALINRLGITFNPKQIVMKAAESILDNLKFRAKIVEDGFDFCRNTDCSEGTFNYEEHSTPTRDKRIVEKFKTVDGLVSNFSDFDETIAPYWENYKIQTKFTVLGDNKTVEEYRQLFKSKLISSHPEDSIAQRWALDQKNIELTINRRFSSKKIQRESIVLKSAACIVKNKCEKGSENWKLYNSYEFDLELVRSIYDSYHKMCELYPCKTNKLLKENDINKIPFYISEPNASNDQRWGKHIDKSMFSVLPKGKVYTQINSDNFVIDNKVYNIKKNKFNVVWGKRENTVVNQRNKFLTSYTGNSLWSYQLDKVISKQEFSGDIIVSKWINDDIFVVKTCESANRDLCEINLFKYDLSAGLVPVKKYSSVYNLKFQTDYEVGSSSNIISFSIKMDLSHLEHYFLYFENDLITEIKSKSTNAENIYLLNGYILFGGYSLQSSQNEFYMIEINSKKTCSIDSSVVINYISQAHTGSGLFVAQISNDNYKLLTPSGLCTFNEVIDFGSSYPWIQFFGNRAFITEGGPKITIITNEAVEVRESINDYKVNAYDENSIYWFKLNAEQTAMVDIYTEEIDTSVITQLDPNNIKFRCDQDMSGFCNNKNEDVFRYIYFSRDENYSYSYNELQVGGKIISTYLKKDSTSTDNYNFQELEMNLKSGTTFNIGKNIIYLK
jgi:hypothetical protein